MEHSNAQLESPWPHRLAWAIVCAAFPLIWVGGMVTTYDAGMAVADWPSTYGYNLFLYPWTTWLTGPFDLFIEHGHRLLAAAVGLLTIAFVVSVFWTDTRRGMRALALVALIGVIVQGVLGGMRVTLDQRTLAMLHACTGPVFFAFAVSLVTVTSRGWRKMEALPGDNASRRLQRLTLFTTLIAYVQLIVGAQLRHAPIDAGPFFIRTALYFHLLLAFVLLIHVVLTYLAVGRLSRGQEAFGLSSGVLLALLVLQVVLGGSTWVVKYGFPQWFGDHSFLVRNEDFLSSLIVTAHVAVGSLILATALHIVLWGFRFFRSAAQAAMLPQRSWIGVTA